MSSPTPMPTALESAPGGAPSPRQRPALVRPEEGRLVAGVAAGVAAHLGWPVRITRIVFMAAVVLNGAGLVLYLWLWALVPNASDDSQGVLSEQVSEERRHRRRLASSDLIIGALMVSLAVVLALSLSGVKFGWSWLWLVGLLPVVGGATLVYTQLDDVEAARWRANPTALGPIGFRVIAGLLLVLAGIGVAASSVLDTSKPAELLLTVTAMIGGALVVLAPWGIRLVRDLGVEQQARAREQVRADIAAHLHDSVLQTLALIQRSSTDPAQVVRLARRQERDLRTWLYGGGPAPSGSLAAAVRAVVDDVEELHAVSIDVIVVGDRVMDERLKSLLAALREALVNAARHAGGTISVYLECTDDAVEAFVKDRGAGFVLDDIPADRHGVRESIVVRMQRIGGSGDVVTAVGEGTEVRLRLPHEAEQETT